MSICPSCGEEPCGVYERCRYPYTHHGPNIYGSKLLDYLISEQSLIQDAQLRDVLADARTDRARRVLSETD